MGKDQSLIAATVLLQHDKEISNLTLPAQSINAGAWRSTELATPKTAQEAAPVKDAVGGYVAVNRTYVLFAVGTSERK